MCCKSYCKTARRAPDKLFGMSPRYPKAWRDSRGRTCSMRFQTLCRNLKNFLFPKCYYAFIAYHWLQHLFTFSEYPLINFRYPFRWWIAIRSWLWLYMDDLAKSTVAMQMITSNMRLFKITNTSPSCLLQVMTNDLKGQRHKNVEVRKWLVGGAQYRGVFDRSWCLVYFGPLMLYSLWMIHRLV